MEQEIEIGGIEDMVKYFKYIREYFITNCTYRWFTNYFVNTIAVRAHQINKGFLEQVNSGNYLCAAPLVRMQLETLCRLFGGLIADGETYIPRFMSGKKVDNCTYNGKQLTYNYLVELLATNFGASQLPRIYADGNKFIHPTDIAFKAAVWSEGKTLIAQNLNSKLHEDEEMEAIKNDMFYVNFCYTKVFPYYQKWLEDNIQLVNDGTETVATDSDTIDSVADTIEGFMDSVSRNKPV